MPVRPKRIHVAFAVVKRRGKFLICQRPAGTHLAGYWEFPGGKREPGETWVACLRREIREELGVGLLRVRLWTSLSHRYPGKHIQFKVFRCGLRGTPKPLQAKQLRWVEAARLPRYKFPPADAGLISRLTCSPKRAML